MKYITYKYAFIVLFVEKKYYKSETEYIIF